MSASEFRLAHATTYTLEALADLFTRGFAKYLLPVQASAAALAERARIEHVDFAASRVVCDAKTNDALAIALIARRGRESRLAAFGVVEEARGRGVGKRAMAELLDDARARRDRAMLLEVFESNTAGVALYERLGFRTRRRLGGWEGAIDGAPDASLREIDPSSLGHALAAERPRDVDVEPARALPWQLRAETFITMGAPLRGLTLDGESIAVVSNKGDVLQLRGLFTRGAHRRAGRATRLVRAAAAELSCTSVAVPQIVPDDAAPPRFFESLGLKRSALAQLEMEMVLER